MLKKQSQAVNKAHIRVSTRRLLCSVSVSVLALLVAPSVVHAQANRNWDANGATAGNGGAGTWNTTTPAWSPNADGTTGPYTPWSNATPDNAIFGGTAGTVTLGEPITVHNVIFNTAGYTLAGDTLTLGGLTPTITGTGTISSVIAGTAGLTTGGGVNTLTLGGANTFTGPLTIAHGGTSPTTGTLVLAPGGSLATSSVVIGTGAPSGTTVAILQNQANNQLTNATVTFNAIPGPWATGSCSGPTSPCSASSTAVAGA
jgi:fibronectin-binding autotransporter adhesin